MNTNAIITNPVTQDIEDSDEINDLIDTHQKQTNVKQETQKQNTINQQTNNSKPANKKSTVTKDSIDDFDDMLQDFEKKYSTSNIAQNSTNNINNNNSNNNNNTIKRKKYSWNRYWF